MNGQEDGEIGGKIDRFIHENRNGWTGAIKEIF